MQPYTKVLTAEVKNWKKTRKTYNLQSGLRFVLHELLYFPHRVFYIIEQLKNTKTEPIINTEAKAEDCIFLTKHNCNIYNERPIICQTHGLPLLYMSEEGIWELSACELNFELVEYQQVTEFCHW